MTPSQSTSIRPVLFGGDGKRESDDTLNKDKDLKNKFCHRPFDFFEAQDLGDGRVFVCCPTWLSNPVGSLTTQSVDESFNSPQAEEIRGSILDGSFKYCNHKICPFIQNDSLPNKEDIIETRHKNIINNNTVSGLTPIAYNLCYDQSCNLSCPSCRANKVYITDGPNYDRKLLIQQKIINKIFNKPHEDHIKVNVTGSGDPFGSKIFRELLFNIDGSKFPNVLINLQTNGVMFTEKYWGSLVKIRNNINGVMVSLDAATEETYSITRRGGDWGVLMNNLKFISSLRSKNKINFIRLDFVVQKENYNEMPSFIRLGKELGVDQCYFSLINDWGTWTEEEYNNHAIWKKNHPEFNDFMEIMKDPIFDEKIVELGNVTEYKNST